MEIRAWLKRLFDPRQIGTHLVCRVCEWPWPTDIWYCAACGIVGTPRMVTDYQDRFTRVQWFRTEPDLDQSSCQKSGQQRQIAGERP